MMEKLASGNLAFEIRYKEKVYHLNNGGYVVFFVRAEHFVALSEAGLHIKFLCPQHVYPRN